MVFRVVEISWDYVTTTRCGTTRGQFKLHGESPYTRVGGTFGTPRNARLLVRSPGMPLCIDLFCGLGGWTEGFLAEGWDVIGFDIERHQYGEAKYPAQLVIQDVLTLHGSQFRNADCIVASPPCQKYSYMAMPWGRAKREVRWQKWERDSAFGDRLESLNALFNACFRIQREAIEATGRECPACAGLGPRHRDHVCPRCKGTCWLTRHIPLVVENVKGAQPWVGPAKANFGSFYFWGDVSMHNGAVVAGKLEFGKIARAAKRAAQKRNPDGTEHPQGSWFAVADSKNRGSKNDGGSWFNIAHNTESGTGQNPDWRKLADHVNIRNGASHTRHLTNPHEHAGLKVTRWRLVR